MPVGTGVVMAWDKFLWDQRDLNCNACRNGFKSAFPKTIENKVFQVAQVCTCVPYYESRDGEGTGVVVYRGRRERWVAGKRQEIDIQAELIREQQGRDLTNRKNDVMDALKNKTKGAKADELKAKNNASLPERPTMCRDKNGHWMLLTKTQAQVLGLTPVDPQTISLEAENNRLRALQAEEALAANQSESQAPAGAEPETNTSGFTGLRQETDEEFLMRASGEVPVVGDPRVISQSEADRLEAAKQSPTAAPAVVTQAAPEVRPVVKKSPGRPKGSTKKSK